MNIKGANQSAQMRRMICTFVVRIWLKQVFHDMAHFSLHLPRAPQRSQGLGWLGLNSSRMIVKLGSWVAKPKTKEPPHDKMYPPSLIRVFAVSMKKAWVLSYPLNTQRRLWSDWVDTQADLSLRWAHNHFVGFVMSGLRSFIVSCNRLLLNWIKSNSWPEKWL